MSGALVLLLSGLGGADGNRYRFCCFRGHNDVALAVKDSARLDYQAMRMNFTRGDSFGVNLHFSLCEDHAIETAGDHYVVALDLPLYAGFLA